MDESKTTPASAAPQHPAGKGSPALGGLPANDQGLATGAPSTGSEPPHQVPNPGVPKVEIGQPERKLSVMQAFASDAGGKLDAAEVQATIDKSAEQLRACITVDSRVNVTMKVLVSGAVGDARAPRATPNDPKARDCVAAVLRKLVFPRPSGNEAASITIDLDLRKQGSP